MDRWALPVTAGVLAGVGAATFAAILLAMAQGSLTPVASLTGLLCGAGIRVIVAGVAARLGTNRGLEASASWADLAAASLFGAVVARQFLRLYVERQGEVRTLDVLNYGELPLHITYFRFFAIGAPFWPENPPQSIERRHSVTMVLRMSSLEARAQGATPRGSPPPPR